APDARRARHRGPAAPRRERAAADLSDPGGAVGDPRRRRPSVLLGAPAAFGRAGARARGGPGIAPAAQDSSFSIVANGVALAGEQEGAGPAVVLMHGLTATRRYVVMGSQLLQRSGLRVVAYDARGHGSSAPAADPRAYGYELLASDLRAVLNGLGLERAVLACASMGAHTALRCALEHPARVRALCLITPAFDPAAVTGPGTFAAWDALARGLRTGGVEGFVRAYALDAVPPAWRDTVEKVLRQRLAAHEHPEAVADALEVVPRSRPF